MSSGTGDRQQDELSAPEWGRTLDRSEGRFAWPPRSPRDAEEKRREDLRGSIDLDPRVPRASTWSQVEQVWLGLSTPPLAQRCEELRWAADSPAAYCPRCGQSSGIFEARRDGCSRCSEKRLPWSRIVRLGEYVPPLSQFVREVKFTAFRRLGVDLGRLLGRSLAAAVREAVVEGELPAGVRVEVIPVPTSFRRRIARGIDHPAVIARAAAREAGAAFCPLLSRSHRPSQVAVSTGSRRRNLVGTMRISLSGRFRAWVGRERAGQVPPTLTVLVDDVTTTGATMREACRAIRRERKIVSGRLWIAVLAVTPAPGA